MLAQLPEVELLLAGTPLTQERVRGAIIGLSILLALSDARGLVGFRRRICQSLLAFCLFSRVSAMPFRLRKEAEKQHSPETQESNVEPPEAAPANMLSHWTGDDGADHEGAKIPGEVQGVVGTSIVQEQDVSDDFRLGCLAGQYSDLILTEC